MHDIVGCAHVVLEMAHEPRSIALHLLGGGDCTEDDLAETTVREHAVRDAADGPERVLDHSHVSVALVVDQTCNVVAWHVGQLCLVDGLEPAEHNHVLVGGVVGSCAEHCLAVVLLLDGLGHFELLSEQLEPRVGKGLHYW